MAKEVTYGEGHSLEDGGQGMWFVRINDYSIEWFDTEAEAKMRAEELSK